MEFRRITYFSYPGAVITVGMKKEMTTENPTYSIQDYILAVVAKEYKTPQFDILGRRRKKELVAPRQMGMYLILMFSEIPQVDIGEFFNRDHATVLHARDKVVSNSMIDRAFNANRLRLIASVRGRGYELNEDREEYYNFEVVHHGKFG
jgi:chromosomal replication initiator protein